MNVTNQMKKPAVGEGFGIGSGLAFKNGLAILNGLKDVVFIRGCGAWIFGGQIDWGPAAKRDAVFGSDIQGEVDVVPGRMIVFLPVVAFDVAGDIRPGSVMLRNPVVLLGFVTTLHTVFHLGGEVGIKTRVAKKSTDDLPANGQIESPQKKLRSPRSLFRSNKVDQGFDSNILLHAIDKVFVCWLTPKCRPGIATRMSQPFAARRVTANN